MTKEEIANVLADVGGEGRRIPVALMFRGEGRTGFDGQKPKMGIFMAVVAPEHGRDGIARSFIGFKPGRVNPFCKKKDEHGYLRPEGLLDPMGAELKTTRAFNFRSSGCECEGGSQDAMLEESLVFDELDNLRIKGKTLAERLNQLTVCPFCHKGHLEDWRQVDPLEPEALRKVFPEDPDTKLNSVLEQLNGDGLERFVPPGLVGLARCRWDEDPDTVPETPLYQRIVQEHHSAVAGDGTSDPHRCDLVNSLDVKSAKLVGLVLAAQGVNIGFMPANDLVAGFVSPRDLPYRVTIRMEYPIKDASRGEGLRLLKMGAKPARAANKRVIRPGMTF